MSNNDFLALEMELQKLKMNLKRLLGMFKRLPSRKLTPSEDTILEALEREKNNGQ